MKRIYIIPFDVNAPDMGFDCCPKYRNLFPGTSQGVIPQVISEEGAKTKKWKTDHYLVTVEAKTDDEFIPLEKMSDVIRVDNGIDLAKIAVVGIDTNNLSELSSDVAKEETIVEWLIGKKRDFTNIKIKEQY